MVNTMDNDSLRTLARLLRFQRVGALGTIRDGGPLVSMVLFAASPDNTKFWLHLSKLALHTKGILNDPHVGLMVAETDMGDRDPQMLGRVSIQGEAGEFTGGSSGYAEARSLYLTKFPEAEPSFGLGDFGLYCLEPSYARLVAGFGKIFTLSPQDFRDASAVELHPL